MDSSVSPPRPLQASYKEQIRGAKQNAAAMSLCVSGPLAIRDSTSRFQLLNDPIWFLFYDTSLTDALLHDVWLVGMSPVQRVQLHALRQRGVLICNIGGRQK